MGFLGCDPDQLRALGTEVQQRGGEVARRTDALERTAAPATWHGEDSAEFTRELAAVVRRSRELADRMGATARELRAQADEQDRASAAEDHADAQAASSHSHGGPAFDPASMLRNEITPRPGEGPLQWIARTTGEGADWLWDNAAVPAINGGASFLAAAQRNPLAAVGLALGLGATAVAASGEVVGVVLLPTGVGTAAGAGAIEVSTLLGAAGLTIAAISGAALVEDAAENPVEIVKATPNPGDTYVPENGSTEGPRPVDEVVDELPQGKQPDVKTVDSDEELQEVFDEMARGGEVVEKPNSYDGIWVMRPDGTRVSMRNGSKSGGRTIDIKYPNRDEVKVHIK